MKANEIQLQGQAAKAEKENKLFSVLFIGAWIVGLAIMIALI